MDRSITTEYVAEFVRASHAAGFAAALLAKPEGYYATNIVYIKGRRKVTWTGPDDPEYRMDLAENVGFYGSPPQGPVATLNGRKTPRSY